MSQVYRDPEVLYRDPSVPYRGAPEPVFIDMQRQDAIDVFLVDKFGNIINELPGAVVTGVEWALLSTGTMPNASLSFSAYDPSIQAVELGTQEVQIRFNDVIGTDGEPLVWWGIMSGDTSEPGTYGFDLEDLSSWFAMRPVEAATVVFGGDTCSAPIDQFSIGWGLVSLAQTGANMDLNITASYNPSGILRCRIYERDQHPFISDALAEFPTLEHGFDWEIVPHADGRRVWTPYYPQKGVHRQDLSFVYDKTLDYGSNIVKFRRTRDMKNVSTRVYATGGSDGLVKFEQSFEDLAASAKYGVRVKVVSDGSQNDIVWLEDKAQQTTYQFNHPQLTLELTVKNHQDINPETGYDPGPLLALLNTGDWFPIQINDGVTQVNQELRLGSYKWNADDTIDLSFIIPVVR